MVNAITVPRRHHVQHKQHLHKFMHIICDCGLVLKPEKSVVKDTCVTCPPLDSVTQF